MSTENRIIIQETTALAFSAPFQPVGTVTVMAGFLRENEGVQIQYTHNGLVWQPLYINNVLQEITSKHSFITIVGPGKFRCLKSATADPVSVALWETEVNQ